ncbi:MAG: hypothetical protein ACRDRL_12365 [Sciscionella sp.]
MAYVIVLPHPPDTLDSFTKNVSKQLGRPKKRYPHLCLAFSPGSSDDRTQLDLSHLGLVFRRGNGTSNYERRLAVHHVWTIDDPVPLEELQWHMATEPGNQIDRAARDQEAILSEVAVNAVLDALISAQPASADMVQWFRSSQDDSRLLRSSHAQMWQHEREAINLGLAIGGITANLAEQWTTPNNDEPYLAGLKPVLAQLKNDSNESHLIDHDANAFPGWRPDSGWRQHIRVFTDGKRRMEVMNVNADPIEAYTGVDLIYYHEQAASFIMVQYKRLDESKRVYADKRFRSQLRRMKLAAEISAPPRVPLEWRISQDSCFFKLAKSTPMDPFSDELVDGLYLPVSYAELLLQSLTPEGQASVSLGYHNIERWLHNTLFLELAKEGWIGTSRASIADVRKLAQESLRSGHSVVWANDKSSETGRERQQRARSRAPKNYAKSG